MDFAAREVRIKPYEDGDTICFKSAQGGNITTTAAVLSGIMRDLKPIRITPEWLERMKFIRTRKGWEYGDVIVKGDPSGHYEVFSKKIPVLFPLGKVQNVHELQAVINTINYVLK